MISILDCTLRDGGYINNWSFGKKVISLISEKICKSAVEYIECGFLSQTKKCDEDQSIFRTIESAEKKFGSCPKNLALMINCGEYEPSDIPDYDGGCISTLRIAFHKHQRQEAQQLSSVLKSKGYNVFFQPMVTMGYSDKELLSLIEWANEYSPDAFYIVDSFGTMRKNDLLRMFYLIDNNLSQEIKIGFHSHNNLQLSFSNAQELIGLSSKREIIIDSSVFGMGRGAGNLCTELITRYINENIEDKYDLIPILEVMDEYIMPIYTLHPWGYSAPYYIAAINNCHPNYATFLMNKQTLCIRDINNIIKSIPAEHKHLYDTQVVNTLYTDYLSHTVDDSAVVRKISDICNNRNILILAPGKSLVTHSETIQQYISENNPVIFSLNHIPELYRCDKIFISNLKRFKNIEDAVDRIGDKLICSSNITTQLNADIVNYSDYLTDNSAISDNSGLMLINLLKKCGVNNFALAGYDGFDISNSKNYFDEKMINNVASEYRERNNKAINDYFKKLKKTSDITFITPSLYNGVEETNV